MVKSVPDHRQHLRPVVESTGMTGDGDARRDPEAEKVRRGALGGEPSLRRRRRERNKLEGATDS